LGSTRHHGKGIKCLRLGVQLPECVTTKSFLPTPSRVKNHNPREKAE
jgi:hypothetical protein